MYTKSFIGLAVDGYYSPKTRSIYISMRLTTGQRALVSYSIPRLVFYVEAKAAAFGYLSSDSAKRQGIRFVRKKMFNKTQKIDFENKSVNNS